MKVRFLMSDKKIQWHPAFCSAMKLELRKNKKDLHYYNEHNLNRKPLQIDLLVIMKEKDAVIDNELGKIFLGHNIMEYKSPDDSMNNDTYFKVLAYAYLYKANESRVDEILLDDITISLIRDIKPIKLLKWFKKHNYIMDKPYNGIYYIEKDGFFKTQVIVSSELDKEHHEWITTLTKKLKVEQAQQLIENIENLTEKDELDLAESVFNVVSEVHFKKFKQIKEDSKLMLNRRFMELIKPEFDEAVDKAANQKANEMANEMASEMANEMASEMANKMVNEIVNQVKEEQFLESVDKIMSAFNVSLEKACSVLQCTVDDYNNAKMLLGK
jgi:hypothetical protein